MKDLERNAIMLPLLIAMSGRTLNIDGSIDISTNDRKDICPNCEKPFDKGNSSKSFCSAKCFKESRK